MKYRSKDSAVDNVRQFFSNNPSDDIVSLEDAFKAWGRNLDDTKGNMSWFSNKLTHLKYHGLVKPLYALRNRRRVLDKIQLTLEGKRALGRIEGGEIEGELNNTNGHNTRISIEEIMKELPRLKRENPEFNIIFSVTPKETVNNGGVTER
jgi:hypothetical protein